MHNASLKKRVMFVANRGYALVSSRALLIQHFVQNNWEVIAVTAEDEYTQKLIDMGAKVEFININRGGLSPKNDIAALIVLMKAYLKYKPDLVHHYHAKPIILGNIASLFSPRSTVINTVTGLGHAFIKPGLTRKIAILGYKLFASRSKFTIFQNNDDYTLFTNNNWIPREKTRLVISSGVDVNRFNVHHRDSEKINVLMAGRLLWQKGVREYVEAARTVRKNYANVTFHLAGEFDLIHPDAVDERYIESAHREGTINFLGYVDMAETLKTTDIFVLPSYREGVPRVLLEAGACGLPIVTTDAPGCREVVMDGENGFLVPVGSSEALADKLIELINDKNLRFHMGNLGRRRIEQEFDIRAITNKYLSIYREAGFEI